MDVRYIRLIEEGEEDLWIRQTDFSELFGQAWAHDDGGLSHGPVEHLRYIKERRGEKIVALDAATGRLMGWIAVFPDRDIGGPIYSLAGIEVHRAHRGKGIGTGLMEAVRQFAEENRVHRLKFGTSPLLTNCARLYVTRFGARYRWRRGVRGPKGGPWPCVSCECDFDDPLAKPLDLRDDEVETLSVLEWDGARPLPRKNVMYSGSLSVVLPELSSQGLTAAIDRVPWFLEILYGVFDALYLHGYGFAWFDRSGASKAALGAAGARRWYYVMKRVVSI
jgi:GNAT superfamily N-acetyltransferase